MFHSPSVRGLNQAGYIPKLAKICGNYITINAQEPKMLFVCLFVFYFTTCCKTFLAYAASTEFNLVNSIRALLISWTIT